jgi:hypothetical protein
MQNFSIPPRAIAENDGVKVGGGGGGLLWEVETEPHVISSLYAPDAYIWYSKKRRERLPPERGWGAIASSYLEKGEKSFDLESVVITYVSRGRLGRNVIFA